MTFAETTILLDDVTINGNSVIKTTDRRQDDLGLVQVEYVGGVGDAAVVLLGRPTKNFGFVILAGPFLKSGTINNTVVSTCFLLPEVMFSVVGISGGATIRAALVE